MIVRGWHTWDGNPVAAVAVEASGVRVVVTPGTDPGAESRPDVAEATGDPALVHSGWRAVLDLSNSSVDNRDETLIAVAVWGSSDAQAMSLAPIRVMLSDEPEPPPADSPSIVGRLDRPAEGELVEALLKVSGWAIGIPTAVSRVEVLVNGRGFGPARLGMPRMDLAPIYGEPHAVVSGFEQLLDLSDLPPGPARIVVRAWTGPSDHVDVADCAFELADGDPGAAMQPVARGEREQERETVLSARRGSLVQRLRQPVTGGDLNLAVVTHGLQIGGAELWLQELLRRSGAGRTYRCRVLSFTAGPLLDELEADGIEVHVTQGQLPPDAESYEGRVTELSMWLAAGGHNAALVNTVLPWIGADAAVRIGLPVVWAIHESYKPEELWASMFSSDPATPEVRATLTRTLRRAQALVFVAEATRQLYVGSVDADRTAVIPYGIDLDAIDAYCSSTSRASARAEVDLDAETRVILSVGMLQPRKAQTVLVAAFAEVADEYPDSLLAIVGDTGDIYGEALAEYVRRLGLGDRIRVVPVTRNTSVWYRAADAFVCGSDIESMPRTILEALAFGLPVAATSVFAIPDLLTDGETGYLFEPRDKGAAVQVLRRLLGGQESDVDRVAAAGHQLAVKFLDSDAYTRELLALVDRLRIDPEARPSDIVNQLIARPAW